MTKLQREYVKGDLSARLGAIISDYSLRQEVVDAIIDDVVADIDETADWSGLDSDEVVMDDIEIALSRVAYSRFIGQ